ncbi:TPA: hypothetical protein ACGI3E_003679 [Clostridioides difficile]|nr:hypothetical protein [Clostridioides difficile]MCR1381579.1 hypothetical protein [Clostridioides difficile]MDI2983529.1 hypothetical protein [Clostridioides difficile]MDK3380730.1 hypothetical protein [Clostridioides difficile]WPV43779.1 hypothetical protein CDIFJ21_05670 [Clostridioides difficile]
MVECYANKITSFLVLNKIIEQKCDLYLFEFKMLIGFIVILFA